MCIMINLYAIVVQAMNLVETLKDNKKEEAINIVNIEIDKYGDISEIESLKLAVPYMIEMVMFTLKHKKKIYVNTKTCMGKFSCV